MECTLPAELQLEIVARSDPATLIRCAATCKVLRRDILDPSFVRRVTQEQGIVPSCLLIAYLRACPILDNNGSLAPVVTLVHPAMPAATRFTNDILKPYMSPCATGLLRWYRPITSRGGLVVLVRRCSEPCSALCVYNPMTGDYTYLPHPPGLSKSWYCLTCVLLTAADGIDCSFMLLVAEVAHREITGWDGIKIQTAASSNASVPNWGPVSHLPFSRLDLECNHDTATTVLHSGVIHWLLSNNDKILTYDIHTEKLCTLELPTTNYEVRKRSLGTSPAGKLRFLVSDRLIIHVWLQLSDGWVPEVVIDVEDKMRSLCPHIPTGLVLTAFEPSGEMSNVVLMRFYHIALERNLYIISDIETKGMRIQDLSPSLLFEVDLPRLLKAMRIFS